MLICETYIIASSLADAFAAMARYGNRGRIVSGCTDTLPWARQGRAGDVEIEALIDVSKIPELNVREVRGSKARIGAATPIQRFLDEPALAAAMPAMPRCAVWFADDQIRAQATVGGNIVNASPAADATPCLLAHDAQVELAKSDGDRIVRRRMALADFVQGAGRTQLADGELLTAIECDALAGYGGAFEKVGHRRSLVISTVCLAALVKLDASGRGIVDARLAIAGIAPTPQRLREVEAALRGAPITAETFERVAEMPLSLIASRSRQEYRREVVRAFMMRGLINAARRAGADSAVLSGDLEAAYA
jgi:carbon-monoxide dehydrogenase medium subunit/xanthine dehydrogenase FAD-binding subunit